MKTISELKAVNKANGMFWFSPNTMQFWRTRIHSGIRKGKYFISSEDNFRRDRRLFSIRTFNDKGEIDTVGEFQAYSTLAEAKEALKDLQ